MILDFKSQILNLNFEISNFTQSAATSPFRKSQIAFSVFILKSQISNLESQIFCRIRKS